MCCGEVSLIEWPAIEYSKCYGMDVDRMCRSHVVHEIATSQRNFAKEKEREKEEKEQRKRT